ncbi:similar to An08g02410 [Aspergillus luchuensis]|uniref:Similar to An08g02410 n=1 Tax=Aspergillus kawachii TaxID=1069201 RepID=A0A146FU80_ASPKA|nr:similar to An08g02410 [Aspergillus luchuensis]
MPPPSRRLLIFQEARNPQSPSEIVYLPVNKLGLPICGDGPEMPSMLELPLRILKAFTDIFNQPKYKGWALVGAGPYHDTSVEGKYYAVVLEQVQEERLDGGRFPAISPSSNSATLDDGDSVGSDDETPTTRYPPTYSLSDGEDKDCAASEIVAPSQITTNPSTSSDGGILTPSQSTATTRAFSPVDVNKSDDPKRDEFIIGDSDGRSKDKKPVSSTGSSYKNPEVATNYAFDTNSEPINDGHSHRQPISTDKVPPRRDPSQAATDLISQIGRSGLTWGAMDPSTGYCIQFDINKAPIPKFVQVSPDTENPSRPDAQSKSNRFTPSTTRKPLPHPVATDGLSIRRDKPYWTEFGLHWPPPDGPLYLPPLDPNDPYKVPDSPL